MPNTTSLQSELQSNTPLRKLMVEELRDLYNAERQMTRALPKLAKKASSGELRELLETHLEETEGHLTRLEEVFEMLGERPRGKPCPGMAGIVEEGGNLLEEDFDGPVLDAGIIAGAQRSEHYEIAAYGAVMAWAKALGLDDVAERLDSTLEEEKAADQKLSALAESSVNTEAAAMSNGQDTDERVRVGIGGGQESNNRARGRRSSARSR